MSAPFGKSGGPVNSVPRNTSDLSFQTNGTYQFGGLYPVLCKDVLPGDSFKIDTTFGLRFMPTAFPLQTRMRADIHFFYVRNRNLWKDWPDFYGKTKKNLSFPILGRMSPSFYKTGSLADHLGLPTAIYGSGSVLSNVSISSPVFLNYYSHGQLGASSLPINSDNIFDFVGKTVLTTPAVPSSLSSPYSPLASCLVSGGAISLDKGDLFRINIALRGTSLPQDRFVLVLKSSDDTVLYLSYLNVSSYETTDQEVDVFLDTTIKESVTNVYKIGVLFPESYLSARTPFSEFYSISRGHSSSLVDYPDITTGQVYYNVVDVSALPFRAYESIYNAFYRDERNNPFVLDGEKEFNKYLPTQEGGVDLNTYKLHFRNWEQDFLTTAVPTPQQGVAPLVGISASGVMSIQDPDSGQVYQVKAKTADDADTIVGYDVTETLPVAVTRSLVNYASSGISINDFRNVNAYQRWLETNIRRGYKYRDMIKSHFDVDISYQELDMPEFIGGVSIDITPQTISQTSQDSESNPLGSYAGQLYGSGSSRNSVTKYFDEHGFLMAILSVVPVPNYSQLLPKYFIKTTDSLDYFSPEFGHIGLQAILNEEVSPLQCNVDNVDGVFGYQRAWYDYLQSVDEVHGQFRTTLRNFVMNRVFDTLPVLGPSFTVIDPEQLNDVFTVREVDGEPIDPILGQIYFDIKAKRPIPRYGVPRLE